MTDEEMTRMLAEKVMGWTLEPVGDERSGTGIAFMEKREGFTNPQWTGFITNRPYGFEGYINTRYEDGRTLIVNSRGWTWEPTIDIDDAWMLLHQLIKQPWEVYLSHQFDGWDCLLARPDRPEAHAHAPDAARAICLAALEAVKP